MSHDSPLASSNLAAPSRPPTAVDRILAWGFSLAIAIPALGGWQGLDLASERQHESPPSWSEILEAGRPPQERIEAMRERVGASFGFRNALLKAHATFDVAVLGVSPTRDVVLGRNEWLFLAAEEAVDDYRSVRPFSGEVLSAVVTHLEAQQRWLAKLGSAYLVIPVPNKHSIYPQQLPAHVDRVGERSRMDQLLEGLAARGTVPTLDLRPALREAASADQIYRRTDTHWNDLGAHAAYAAIIARVSQLIGPPGSLSAHPLDDFTRIDRLGEGGDLARMLGLRDQLQERVPKLSPRFQPLAARAATGNSLFGAAHPPHESLRSMSRQKQAPRAMVFHDSFGDALVPLLAEHFRSVHFLPEESLDILRQGGVLLTGQRPDIVIQLFAERRLMRVGRRKAETRDQSREPLPAR